MKYVSPDGVPGTTAHSISPTHSEVTSYGYAHAHKSSTFAFNILEDGPQTVPESHTGL